MKKILVGLTVLAMAISGVFATDTTQGFNVSLTLNETIVKGSFDVYVVEDAVQSVPENKDSNTSINQKDLYFDTTKTSPEYSFTVLWYMTTGKTSGIYNAVGIKVSTLKNSATDAAESDILSMTATVGTVIDGNGTVSSITSLPSEIELGKDTADSIVAFSSVSAVNTKGGVPFTLTVNDLNGTSGATYTTTVTLNITSE